MLAIKKAVNGFITLGLYFQAFPCISTGIYGYPPLNAALIALKVVKKFLIQHPGKMDRVIFCLFMENDVDIYEKNLQIYFPMWYYVT